MAQPSDRRKHARTDAKLSAGLRRPGDSGVLTATTLNVGAGGVYVEVPRFIEPLTKLEIALDLPDPAGSFRVEAEGIVVRTDPETEQPGVQRYQLACAFLTLTEEQRQAIQRWVAAQRAHVP